MEITGAMLIGAVLGGIIAVWFLQTIIDVFIISRVMDDPVNGKILATISGYAIASLLYLAGSNSGVGFLYYLPGALLIGFRQYRKGLEVRQKIAEASVSNTFD